MRATPASGMPAHPATPFRRWLWALVWPEPRHRTVVTVPGAVLVVLSLGVGMAAYNSSSNILFIALSLLLACLILSGIVAWLNLAGLTWRLVNPRAFRAGLPGTVAVEIGHSRRLLPAYALWFEFEAREEASGPAAAPATTFTARGIDFRAVLARASGGAERGRAGPAPRLDPGRTARVEWVFTPRRRGVVRVRLRGYGSFFPFGFLGKFVSGDGGSRAHVRPARVAYRQARMGAGWRQEGEESLPAPGSGGDPLSVRGYQAGDSHRLIHWKATARTRRVMVRQFSVQAEGRLWLEVPADPSGWADPEQFERVLGLAASLAEDLFREGRLAGARLVGRGGAAREFPVRGIADLEGLLDALAEVDRPEPGIPDLDAPGRGRPPPAVQDPDLRKAAAGPDRPGLLILSSDGPRGVRASIDGQPLFTA